MSSTTTPSSSSSSSSKPDVSHIRGNAPTEIKERLSNIKAYFRSFAPTKFQDLPNTFGKSISNRFAVTEISILSKVDEESKLEGKVVVEIEVDEEMINGAGNIHGGCSAFLVDVCSSLSISALSLATVGKEQPSVSQAINMIYHSPATLGDKLRIVNTSMTLGNRTQSCRTEIWNSTHHRLVASGTHVKMMPSPPPQRANL